MSTSLRALIVEDSEDDAKLLTRELWRGGYDLVFERVDTPEAMMCALDNQTWDVVLADYVLPRFSGLAALELLKEREIDLPFIVVSGVVGEDVAVETMKAGAQDYVSKGNLARLLPAVERELREALVRRERRWAQEELGKAHDELELRVRLRTDELARANEALRAEIEQRTKAENELQAVFEALPDLFFRLDSQGTILEYRAGRKGDPYSPPEAFLEKTVRKVLPVEVAQRIQEAIIRVLSTSSLVSLEYSLPTPKGEQVYEARLLPLSETQVVAIVRNITEQKRSEQERQRLIEANEKLVLMTMAKADRARHQTAELKALLESLSEGVVVVDAAGRVLLANPAAKDLIGLSDKLVQTPEDLHALGIRVLRPDGTPLPPSEWVPNRVLERVAGRQCLIIVRADGSRRQVVVGGSAIRGREGGTALAIFVLRDVTEVRELERLREEYLSLISHDLRNPVAVIQGNAHILQLSPGKPGLRGDRRKAIDYIVDAARRLDSMVQDLVDSMRLQSGKLPLDKKPVVFRTLCSEFLERQRTLPGWDRIRFEAPADLFTVEADPMAIERVLVNLLTNALRYSEPETKVVLRAEVARGEMLVSVADRGKGISPEDLPHVFERFHKFSGPQKAGGIGLGLYITRMLVEAHGGRVWAESEQGKGAIFHFTLPLA